MVFDELKYRAYANRFWDELNKTFWQKKEMFGYLPIVFAEPPTEKVTKYIQGVTSIHVNDKKKVYSCFPTVFIRPDNTDEQLCETIRHEIIHYFLALHYYNHEDNTALFYLLCGLFDGGAYESLSDLGQNILNVATPYLEQAYAIFVRNIEEKDKRDLLAMQLSMMLSVIDDVEYNHVSDDKSLNSTLSLLLNRCRAIIDSK